jgi:hypothetical protein
MPSMKPRFSIITLLGVTAYVALALAAITIPSLWYPVWAFVWLLCVTALVVRAIDTTDRVTAGCGRAAIAGLALCLIWALEDFNPWLRSISAAPPSTLMQWPMRTVIQSSCALAFGWVAYYMAYRHYRRNEKAQPESGGP